MTDTRPFIHSHPALQGGTKPHKLQKELDTTLYDMSVNQPCIVDLGRGPGPIRPRDVAWSPDGRFLAMIVTADDPRGVLYSSHLVVLDTDRGIIHRPVLPAHIVTEMAWAPNSHLLLTLGEVKVVQGLPIQKLFLVHIGTQNTHPNLPKMTFGGDTVWSRQMAWGGRNVAIKCPAFLKDELEMVEDRICTISVELRP